MEGGWWVMEEFLSPSTAVALYTLNFEIWPHQPSKREHFEAVTLKPKLFLAFRFLSREVSCLILAFKAKQNRSLQSFSDKGEAKLSGTFHCQCSCISADFIWTKGHRQQEAVPAPVHITRALQLQLWTMRNWCSCGTSRWCLNMLVSRWITALQEWCNFPKAQRECGRFHNVDLCRGS